MDGYVPNRYPTFGTVLYPNNVNIDGRQRHRQRSQGVVRERERKRVTCGGYEPSGVRAVLDPAQSSRLKKSSHLESRALPRPSQWHRRITGRPWMCVHSPSADICTLFSALRSHTYLLCPTVHLASAARGQRTLRRDVMHGPMPEPSRPDVRSVARSSEGRCQCRVDHHRNTNRCTHIPSVLTYAKSLQAAAAGVMSILGCLELDIRRRPRSRFDGCRSSLITIIPATSARARWVASIEERTPLPAAGRRRRLRLGIRSSRFTVRGNQVLVGSCLTESKRGDCAGYENGCRYAGVE